RGHREHRLAEVAAGGDGSAGGGGGHQVAGARCEVQEPGALPDAPGVQQRLDRLAGERQEAALVAADRALPAVVLRPGERVRRRGPLAHAVAVTTQAWSGTRTGLSPSSRAIASATRATTWSTWTVPFSAIASETGLPFTSPCAKSAADTLELSNATDSAFA